MIRILRNSVLCAISALSRAALEGLRKITDSCPLLAAKLARLRERSGEDSGAGERELKG